MDYQAFSRLTRKPRRVTISMPDKIFCQLIERSQNEGRSMSNLSAYLLEQALSDLEPPKRKQ